MFLQTSIHNGLYGFVVVVVVVVVVVAVVYTCRNSLITPWQGGLNLLSEIDSQ
jgi:hypothetical protein